jgi:SAM-dependent methyltransferase
MNYDQKCPVCFSGLNELNKFPWGSYKVIHCNKCGLDYCSLMIQKEKSGDSSPVNKEGIEMMASILHKTEKIAQKYANRRIEIFESLLMRKCENILEVGCGAGTFYNPYKKNSIEWDGIDINPYWKLFGKNNNIPISNKPLEDIEKKYDVILSYQVLEHIENPIPFMNEIKSKLKPGGILHLELPNQNALSAKIRRISTLISKDYGFIQPPMHLRAYQKKTIRYLFNNISLNTKMLFECGNSDKSWGQVRDYNLLQKALYTFSGKVGYGSLLVGIAQKPF